MTWGFIWLMFVLKIPIIGLLMLVWYAVKAEPEPAEDSGDGGIRRPDPSHGPRPRRPRQRGPHGMPLPASPPRVRTTAVAREPATPHR